MIITICILGGLLLCTIFVIAALWFAIGKLMDAYAKDNPKAFMKYYFDNETIERYKCTLLLTINDSADFDGSVYGSKEGWGLFSATKNATIKNLTVKNANFNSYSVIPIHNIISTN